MIKVRYINLYEISFSKDLCHWAGSLYKTKKEALKYKDENKKHFIGKVLIKEKK